MNTSKQGNNSVSPMENTNTANKLMTNTCTSTVKIRNPTTSKTIPAITVWLNGNHFMYRR
ncbi:hypothetical protein D3C73_1572070 [compost metagenome]